MRKFTVLLTMALIFSAGLALTAQTAPPKTSQPYMSFQIVQPKGIEVLKQQLEREMSQQFREAGKERGVRFPDGAPIPGLFMGILPDRSFIAAAPSADLLGLSSIPRRDLALGKLYLAASGRSSLPSGFYKLVLLAGQRQVLLVGRMEDGRDFQRSFPTRIEPSPVDSSRSPTIVSQWKLSPTPGGSSQQRKVKVTVHFDRTTITVEIDWP